MVRSRTNRTRPIKLLCVVGTFLCLIFISIDYVWQYHNDLGLDKRQRILPTVGLYFFASVIALLGLRIGIKIRRQDQRLIRVIVGFAIGFRAIQLCVSPILEIDLYRYMWDGIVTNHGISPYRFSPSQVLTKQIQFDDPVHRRVVELSSKTEAIHSIVSTVHFPEYSSIYPPVSQAVFAVTMWIVPDDASVPIQLFAMKTTLVLFDVLTIFGVLGLVRKSSLSQGWLIAYAWNPLVIKEIANSGHLDSIAVFLVVGAVYCFLPGTKNTPADAPADPNFRLKRETGSGILLALATGAKIYPIILVPFFAMVIGRYRWKRAVSFCGVYVATLVIAMIPMLVENPLVKSWFQPAAPVASDELPEEEGHLKHPLNSDLARSPVFAPNRLPFETQETIEPTLPPKEGLTSFLSQWRMNDLVFSVFFENAKVHRDKSDNKAWYVIVPKDWRVWWNGVIERRQISQNPPFLAARMITGSLFVLAYVLLVRFVCKFEITNDQFLSSIFLILAIFFTLQPTQNPWYWVWATPFVCFARNRGWLFVGLFLFAYYLRFWFRSPTLELQLGAYRYTGVGIFDHCLVWAEHAAIWIFVFFGGFIRLGMEAIETKN